MLEDLPYSTVVALAIALTPALLQWWSGRGLVRAMHDPALPERLLATQRFHGPIVGIAIGILVAGWRSQAIWMVPLAIVARVVAAYPRRRALFNETWSLPGYVAFAIRALFAFFGFWILLAAMPSLAIAAGDRAWPTVLAIAAVLIGWSAVYNDVVRRVMRARPITSVAQISRFESLAAACETPPPRFEYFDLRGGAIANAVALAHVKRPAVVFTDTLLALLDQDEAAAICAHELAHLEYYNRQRLRQLAAINLAIIGLGILLVWFQQNVDRDVPVFLIWTGVILVMLTARARSRQRNETESDLRAVGLTGDPDALISALTKLHTFARVPRRWDSNLERHATHPSLARRVRDIRAAAAIVPAPLPGTPSFRSADGRIVTFAPDGMQLAEGDTATHLLRYQGLTELRLDARRFRGVRLIAVQRDGKRWKVPIAEPDVASVQSALDVADGRLAEPTGLTRHWPGPVRLITMLAALSALTVGQFAMLILAILTAFEQSPPFLASAGVAAVATGLVALGSGNPTMTSYESGLAVTTIVFGAVLVWTAWSVRDEVKPVRVRLLLATLGICSACTWAVLLSDGLGIVELHHRARALPSAAVLTLALTAGLAVRPQRWARAAAAGTCAAGLCAAAAGTMAFLDRYGHDPLLLPMPSMTLRMVAGTPARTFNVPFEVSEVVLSPTGRHLALKSETTRPGNDDEEVTTFHIGRAGEPLTTIEADDLVFADDDHVIVLDQRDGSTRLREVSVSGSGNAIWQQEIPEIFAAALSADPATHRWRVLGWDNRGELGDVEGVVGASSIVRRRWPLRESRDGSWPIALAASNRGPLVVNIAYETSVRRGALAALRQFVAAPLRSTLTVRRADAVKSFDAGSSRLRAGCFDETLPTGRVLCGVFDGSRTRFVALDVEREGPTAVGSLDGRFFSHRRVINGWLSGWLGSRPVAIRVGGPEAVQVKPDSSDYLDEIAANDAMFVTVSSTDAGSTLRMYSRR